MGVTLKSDPSDLSDKMGALCDTPRVCLLLFGMALAKSCRWGLLKFLIPAVDCKAEGAALLRFKSTENTENTENAIKWCAAQSDSRVIAVKG